MRVYKGYGGLQFNTIVIPSPRSNHFFSLSFSVCLFVLFSVFLSDPRITTKMLVRVS